jgi:hypothetical protein
MRHTEHMLSIIFSAVAHLTLPYFSTLPHKLHYFHKKNNWTQNVFWFSPRLFRKSLILRKIQRDVRINGHIAYCNDSVTTQNVWFFQERLLKVLKCYNLLWVQGGQNCPPAASFINSVMTLYLLSASADVSLCTNNSKMPNFELWHSCRKWPICLRQKYP